MLKDSAKVRLVSECPSTESALLPGVSLLAATAARPGASTGVIATLFGHCTGIPAAAFLSHFRFHFSVGLPQV